MKFDIESNLIKNIALYGLIGCFASGTDAVLFSLLTYLFEVPILLANIISVSTGITISFTLNRKYNFKVKDHPIIRASLFFAIGIFGLGLSQIMLLLGTQVGFEPLLIKLLSIIVVAIIQFLLNRFISFGLKL